MFSKEELEGLIPYVQGKQPYCRGVVPWACVNRDPWALIKICLEKWKIILYNSLRWRWTKEISDKRMLWIQPLLRMLLSILKARQFYKERRDIIYQARLWRVKSTPEKWSYDQYDSIQYGPYFLKMVETLLIQVFVKSGSEAKMKSSYRKHVREMVWRFSTPAETLTEVEEE